MNRKTKALARLGTLAVIAGTVLGTPLAIGTASASIGIIHIVDGTIVSHEVAAAGDYDANGKMGSVEVDTSDSLTLQLTGGTSYFPINQGAATDAMGNNGTATYVSPTKVTCATNPCRAIVGDASAEATTVTVVDSTTSPVSSVISSISFNGLFFNGCPGSGIDNGVVGGITYGHLNEPTAQNCVTQGTFGNGTPVNVTVHYAAASPAGANVNQPLIAHLNNLTATPGPTAAVFSSTQPGTDTFIDTHHVRCTTDASGNCTFAVVNPGPTPILPTDTETSAITVETEDLGNQFPLPSPGCPVGGCFVGNYPSINARPSSGAKPGELINWGSGPVAPARFTLESSQTIAPDSQVSSGVQQEAEPGDALELTYELEGACIPDNTTSPPMATCTGTPLAGVSTTVTTDHGFFTPNCISGGVHEYAGCSFTTAPAAGGVVGNLTSSGTTETVSTGPDGRFTVTVGIGRDTAFDQNGVITTHITDGTLRPVDSGDRDIFESCHSDEDVQLADVPGGISTPDNGDCPIDFQWTTAEEPLNGGTAKLVAIPAIGQPNNTAVQSENNSAATDSGTTNVPDVNRVDFLIHETDQFGNLTSGTDEMGDGADSGAPTATKTGPGWLYGCSGFSSTSACTGATSSAGFTDTAQPDGTTTQTTDLVVGSYLALVQDPTFSSGTPDGQIRGQLDTNGDGNINLGYPCTTAFAGCTDSHEATPGVHDGTTTLTLTWTAPVTTFATFIAGSPAAATYSAGTAAAANDVYTVNFYNQLAQPVVTFTVKPGSSVPTATAVTVAATVVDQFANPIVNQTIDAVRSGANESSCTPSQQVSNGGNVENSLFTNTSGVAGYTWTCDSPGASTVSMVVIGPGGTQLATGKQTVTFTGNAVHVKGELPTITKLTSTHAGGLTVHLRTTPALSHARINIYRKLNGLYHLLGSVKTGHLGHATKHLSGLHRGVHYNIAVKAVGIGAGFKSHYSHHKGITIA